MADQSHLDILKQGVEAWNSWMKRNLSTEGDDVRPDFTKANLSGANLFYAELAGADLTEAKLSGASFFKANLTMANLSGAHLHETRFHQANLSEADLRGATLYEADLSEADLLYAMLTEANLTRAVLYGAHLRSADLPEANLSKAKLIKANLSEADLHGATLTETNLSGADLSEADLRGATLSGADLSGADLSEADLRRAMLIETNLFGANLSGADLRGSALLQTNLQKAILDGCLVYGISAWGLRLEGAKQRNLNISDRWREPDVMVDNLEVAQFIYLLLNNEKIRDVLNTIGEKGVLILRRFTEERKPMLDAIRARLRELGFVPMMFDFERPTQQDFTQTIKTLAGLSRFIIADITNPRSSPLELQATMPDYMVPFVPIIQEDEEPFAMFRDLQQKYGEWVLDVLEYDSASNLLQNLEQAVVSPALDKSNQLILKKAEAIRKRHIKDYQ